MYVFCLEKSALSLQRCQLLAYNITKRSKPSMTWISCRPGIPHPTPGRGQAYQGARRLPHPLDIFGDSSDSQSEDLASFVRRYLTSTLPFLVGSAQELPLQRHFGGLCFYSILSKIRLRTPPEVSSGIWLRLRFFVHSSQFQIRMSRWLRGHWGRSITARWNSIPIRTA